MNQHFPQSWGSSNPGHQEPVAYLLLNLKNKQTNKKQLNHHLKNKLYPPPPPQPPQAPTTNITPTSHPYLIPVSNINTHTHKSNEKRVCKRHWFHNNWTWAYTSLRRLLHLVPLSMFEWWVSSLCLQHAAKANGLLVSTWWADQAIPVPSPVIWAKLLVSM